MLKVDFQKRLGAFQLSPSFASEDELVVLFGPSGSGKSQTLRALAGLLRPDSGYIELPQGAVFDASRRLDVSPQRRGVGYVVQDLALFPHLNVAENIAFALDGWAREQVQQRVRELIVLLGLEGLEQRRPAAISGGQQQRVALGRALAARPRLLLLDEPFSALDAPVRQTLRREVARLRRELGLAVVFVTHDLGEAYSLADSMAVYDEGQVLQFGSREEIFRQPATTRVATLLEARNVFQGTVVARTEAFLEIETPWFRARARLDNQLQPGAQAALCVRPEHVILTRPERIHGGLLDSLLEAEIVDEDRTADSHRLYLRLLRDGEPLDCVFESEVSDYPYEVMGIASNRRWRLALPLEKTAAIPI